MSKIIIIAVGGVIAGVAVALGVFFFLLGGRGTSEAEAAPTPVRVDGKLGPHIKLADRVFNLQGGTGTQYLKLQTIVEFETTSKDWAKVLHGCVATRATSQPLVSANPGLAAGDAIDREGKADPCQTKQDELQAEFEREIGTGRQLMEDAVLTVVSRHTAADVASPEGKEALKNEIKAAVQKLIKEPKVTRVIFTNFITQ